MLADAISAEAFKLSRNRLTSFFAYLFLPVAAIGVGIVSELLMNNIRPNDGIALPQAPFDAGQALVGAIQQSSNPLALLFCLIGAAVLFAGEYRWETWRLMMPRNTRTNQMLGKIVVYVAACGLSLLLASLATLLMAWLGALIDGKTIISLNADSARTAAGYFGVGWAHLAQAGAVAALAAVLTRSIMAALMVPLGVGIAQGILQAISGFIPPENLEWWRPFAMPAMAADLLRNALSGGVLPGLETSPMLVWASLGSFAVWIVAGFVGALLLFFWQDLSKE